MLSQRRPRPPAPQALRDGDGDGTAPQTEAPALSAVPVGDTDLLKVIYAPRLPAVGPAYETRLVSRAGIRSLRTAFARRLFDVIVASMALVALGPVMAVVALAIVTTSRGPVLFRQPRVGLRGRLFPCLKFRTMVVGADQQLATTLLVDENRLTAFASSFKLVDDPRVTRVGHILRRFSLDEVPQFVNVLRGEMSIVGPRPLVPQELWRYGDLAQVVLQVKPGMTGPWQVSGRSLMAYEDRIRADVDYALHRSLRGDIEIVRKTFACVLAPERCTAV